MHHNCIVLYHTVFRLITELAFALQYTQQQVSGRADKNAERKLQSITSSKVHQKVDRRQTIDIRVQCIAKLSLLSIFTTQRTSLCLIM